MLLIEMLESSITGGVDIASISIIRNGYLVADIYMFPANTTQEHALYSCTKNFTSTLIGMAIDKGYITSVEQHMVDYFPERSIRNMGELKRAITLENMLTDYLHLPSTTKKRPNPGKKGAIA